MKINVLSHAIHPAYISSSETQKYVDYLESSSLFESEVNRIRTKFEIDNSWFTIPYEEQELDGQFIEKYGKVEYHKKYDDFLDECRLLTSKMNVPYHWFSSIHWFVAFNNFVTLEKPEFEVFPGINFKSNSRWLTDDAECNNTAHLVIKEFLTKPQLHKLIDENWSRIEECMNLLSNPMKHKWLRSDLAKHIVELRDKSKLSFPSIAESLAKQYENDSDLYPKLTEDYVKNLYHRWKKKVLVA
jgi:hypothetical protein